FAGSRGRDADESFDAGARSGSAPGTRDFAVPGKRSEQTASLRTTSSRGAGGGGNALAGNGGGSGRKGRAQSTHWTVVRGGRMHFAGAAGGNRETGEDGFVHLVRAESGSAGGQSKRNDSDLRLHRSAGGYSTELRVDAKLLDSYFRYRQGTDALGDSTAR